VAQLLSTGIKNVWKAHKILQKKDHEEYADILEMCVQLKEELEAFQDYLPMVRREKIRLRIRTVINMVEITYQF